MSCVLPFFTGLQITGKDKCDDKESSLDEALQRSPVDIRKDAVLRGMGGIQMNMAFERRTELCRHPDSRCLCAGKAAMGPPITAGKC